MSEKSKAVKPPVFGRKMSRGLKTIVGGVGYTFGCGSCGRRWEMPYGGYAVGFVKSAAKHHTFVCARRTPAERRATNARDEKRWSKAQRKNADVSNDAAHPGLRDGTVTPEAP